MIEQQVSYCGYPLYSNTLDHLPNSYQVVVNTINQYSFCIAEKDTDFKKALINSDVLLPDGVGIVVALKATTGRSIKKIAGADLHKHLLEQCNKGYGRCFYLGASVNTLEKIKSRLTVEYPNITVGSYSPPFKPSFTEDDNRVMIDKVNEFKPDVLFVGMTAPKQEKWSYQHKGQLDAKIICSIGAVFDFYAGTVTRPVKFWIDIGLEWFIRLCKEPKRMSKRYLYYGPIFLYSVLKEKLHPRT